MRWKDGKGKLDCVHENRDGFTERASGRGGRMETGSWTASMKSRTALQKGHLDEMEGWKWKKGLRPHNLGDGL